MLLGCNIFQLIIYPRAHVKNPATYATGSCMSWCY